MTSIPLPADAVRIANTSARSPIAISGWGAALFGAAFLAAGSGILYVAGYGPDAKIHAPRWVVAIAGVVFTAVGAWVAGNGMRDIARKSAAARQAASYPGQPWLWDYPWRADGVGSDTGREIARAFGFAAFIALFLTPFHWIGFFSRSGSRMFGILALLFDLVAVWLLVRGVQLIAMRRRYGRSWLVFDRFPFHPGGRVELSLDSFGGLSLVPKLAATLRCVQERYETRRSGNERTTEVVCYQLWSATASVEKDRRGVFRFAFELPPGAPGSALSERPARYWELELASDDVPGVDYRARFLVPVYVRGQEAGSR